MEKEGIVIREYDNDDDMEIVSFFKSAYPRGWRSLENWEWLFHKNPYKNNILIIARNENNDIVSAMHTMPIYFKMDKEIFLSYYGTDGAVHKDYREKGLFNVMVKKKDELLYNTGAKLQYTHTVNPILIKQYSRDRIKVPFEAKYFIYIDDVDLHTNYEKYKYKIIKKYMIKLMKYVNKLVNIDFRYFKDDIKIKTLDNFGSEYDELWNDVTDHYDFIIKKDKEYLNWRYIEKSDNNYIVREVRKNNDLLGFIVLKIDYDGQEYPFGHIVDLMVHPKNIEYTSILIKDALKFFKINKVNIIESLVIKKHPYEKYYKMNGFIETGKQSHIFLLHKGLDREIKNIQSSSVDKKHFSQGELFII